MKYDFDLPIDRRGTYSEKWNVGNGVLPMWIADMDFLCAPDISEAIRKRTEHELYGYTGVSDEWYGAYTGWWSKRHGIALERDALLYSIGVVASISSMIRSLTEKDDRILLMSPVYNAFYRLICNNERQLSESELVYKDGTYSVDYDDLEAKLADEKTMLMILCNPHNPIGKIWDKATLAKIGELAAKHHVTVISDEIHCDITEPGKSYVPFASVNDTCKYNSITCISATKAFNFAGINSSAVYVADPELRKKVKRGLDRDEIAQPNTLSEVAAVAALTKGAEWLDQFNCYISGSRKIAAEYIAERIGGIKLVPADATYLLWLDCSKITDNADILADEILSKSGLMLTSGSHYGNAGRCFMRMNIACPRSSLEDGLGRLEKSING